MGSRRFNDRWIGEGTILSFFKFLPLSPDPPAVSIHLVFSVRKSLPLSLISPEEMGAVNLETDENLLTLAMCSENTLFSGHDMAGAILITTAVIIVSEPHKTVPLNS